PFPPGSSPACADLPSPGGLRDGDSPLRSVSGVGTAVPFAGRGFPMRTWRLKHFARDVQSWLRPNQTGGRRSMEEVSSSGWELADHVLPAQVRTQHFRNRHAPVRVLVVLQDGHHAAGGRHRGRVQRVGDKLLATDLAGPDVESPGLVVRAVAAADHLAVRLLPWRPGLDVVLLRRDRSDVSGADVHDAVRDLEGTVDRLAVSAEFLVPGPAVLRAAEDELLHLVELVHPEQALRVHAMGPDLATELGRQARQGEGELADVNHLVHE